MIVRPATPDDIPALLAMAELYVRESRWGYTFHRKRSLQTIEESIDSPYCGFVVGELDGEIAGAWLGVMVYEWTVEPLCYLTKFYVLPRARGTGMARLLMRSFCDWSDKAGAVDSFATATSLVNDPLFRNLLKKFGFNETGPTMVRRHEQHIRRRQEERETTATPQTH